MSENVRIFAAEFLTQNVMAENTHSGKPLAWWLRLGAAILAAIIGALTEAGTHITASMFNI